MGLETQGKAKIAKVNLDKENQSPKRISSLLEDTDLSFKSLTPERRKEAQRVLQNMRDYSSGLSLDYDHFSPNERRYWDMDSAEQRFIDNNNLSVNVFGDDYKIKQKLKDAQGFWDTTGSTLKGFGAQLIRGFYDNITSWSDIDSTIAVGAGYTDYGPEEDTAFTKMIHKWTDEVMKNNTVFTTGEEGLFEAVSMANQLQHLGYSVGIILESFAEQALLTAITVGTGGGTAAAQGAAAAAKLAKIKKILELGGVGSKIAKATGWGARTLSKGAIFGIAQGVKELSMNSQETYRNIKEKLIAEGFSEEDAEVAALEGMKSAIREESIYTIGLSMLQYSLMGNVFKAKTRNPFTREVNGAFSWGISDSLTGFIGRGLGKLGVKEGSLLSKGLDYAIQPLVESVEEGVQTYVSNKWTEKTLNDNGVRDYLSLNENIFNKEFYESMIGGALGGGFFKLAGKVGSKLSDFRNRDRIAAYNEEIEENKNKVNERFKHYNLLLSTLSSSSEEGRRQILTNVNRINVRESLIADYKNGNVKSYEAYRDMLETLIQDAKEKNSDVASNGIKVSELESMLEEATAIRDNLITNYNKTKEDFGAALHLTDLQYRKDENEKAKTQYEQELNSINADIQNQKIQESKPEMYSYYTDKLIHENELEDAIDDILDSEYDENSKKVLERINEINQLRRDNGESDLTHEEQEKEAKNFIIGRRDEIRKSLLEDDSKKFKKNAESLKQRKDDLEQKKNNNSIVDITPDEKKLLDSKIKTEKDLRYTENAIKDLDKEISKFTSKTGLAEYRAKQIEEYKNDFLKKIEIIDKDNSLDDKMKLYLKRQLLGMNNSIIHRLRYFKKKYRESLLDEVLGRQNPTIRAVNQVNATNNNTNIINNANQQSLIESLKKYKNPNNITLNTIIEDQDKYEIQGGVVYIKDGNNLIPTTSVESLIGISTKVPPLLQLSYTINNSISFLLDYHLLTKPTEDDVNQLLSSIEELLKILPTNDSYYALVENFKKELQNKGTELESHAVADIIDKLGNYRVELEAKQYTVKSVSDIVFDYNNSIEDTKRGIDALLKLPEYINIKDAVLETYSKLLELRQKYEKEGLHINVGNGKGGPLVLAINSEINGNTTPISITIDYTVTNSKGEIVGVLDIDTNNPLNDNGNRKGSEDNLSVENSKKLRMSLIMDMLYMKYGLSLRTTKGTYNIGNQKFSPLNVITINTQEKDTSKITLTNNEIDYLIEGDEVIIYDENGEKEKSKLKIKKPFPQPNYGASILPTPINGAGNNNGNNGGSPNGNGGNNGNNSGSGNGNTQVVFNITVNPLEYLDIKEPDEIADLLLEIYDKSLTEEDKKQIKANVASVIQTIYDIANDLINSDQTLKQRENEFNKIVKNLIINNLFLYDNNGVDTLALVSNENGIIIRGFKPHFRSILDTPIPTKNKLDITEDIKNSLENLLLDYTFKKYDEVKAAYDVAMNNGDFEYEYEVLDSYIKEKYPDKHPLNINSTPSQNQGISQTPSHNQNSNAPIYNTSNPVAQMLGVGVNPFLNKREEDILNMIEEALNVLEQIQNEVEKYEDIDKKVRNILDKLPLTPELYINVIKGNITEEQLKEFKELLISSPILKLIHTFSVNNPTALFTVRETSSGEYEIVSNLKYKVTTRGGEVYNNSEIIIAPNGNVLLISENNGVTNYISNPNIESIVISNSSKAALTLFQNPGNSQNKVDLDNLDPAIEDFLKEIEEQYKIVNGREYRTLSELMSFLMKSIENDNEAYNMWKNEDAFYNFTTIYNHLRNRNENPKEVFNNVFSPLSERSKGILGKINSLFSTPKAKQSKGNSSNSGSGNSTNNSGNSNSGNVKANSTKDLSPNRMMIFSAKQNWDLDSLSPSFRSKTLAKVLDLIRKGELKNGDAISYAVLHNNKQLQKLKDENLIEEDLYEELKEEIGNIKIDDLNTYPILVLDKNNSVIGLMPYPSTFDNSVTTHIDDLSAEKELTGNIRSFIIKDSPVDDSNTDELHLINSTISGEVSESNILFGNISNTLLEAFGIKFEVEKGGIVNSTKKDESLKAFVEKQGIEFIDIRQEDENKFNIYYLGNKQRTTKNKSYEIENVDINGRKVTIKLDVDSFYNSKGEFNFGNAVLFPIERDSNNNVTKYLAMHPREYKSSDVANTDVMKAKKTAVAITKELLNTVFKSLFNVDYEKNKKQLEYLGFNLSTLLQIPSKPDNSVFYLNENNILTYAKRDSNGDIEPITIDSKDIFDNEDLKNEIIAAFEEYINNSELTTNLRKGYIYPQQGSPYFNEFKLLKFAVDTYIEHYSDKLSDLEKLYLVATAIRLPEHLLLNMSTNRKFISDEKGNIIPFTTPKITTNAIGVISSSSSSTNTTNSGNTKTKTPKTKSTKSSVDDLEDIKNELDDDFSGKPEIDLEISDKELDNYSEDFKSIYNEIMELKDKNSKYNNLFNLFEEIHTKLGVFDIDTYVFIDNMITYSSELNDNIPLDTVVSKYSNLKLETYKDIIQSQIKSYILQRINIEHKNGSSNVINTIKDELNLGKSITKEDLDKIINLVNELNAEKDSNLSKGLSVYVSILSNILEESISPLNINSIIEDAVNDYNSATNTKLILKQKEDSSNVELQDNNEEELTVEELEQKDESFFTEEWYEDSKKSVTKEIRALLAGVKKGTTTILGLDDYYEFDTIFDALETIFNFPSAVGSDITKMLNAIANNINRYPFLEEIHKKLSEKIRIAKENNTEDKDINMLLYIMNKRYTTFYSTHSTTEGLSLIEANSNSATIALANQLYRSGENIQKMTSEEVKKSVSKYIANVFNKKDQYDKAILTYTEIQNKGENKSDKEIKDQQEAYNTITSILREYSEMLSYAKIYISASELLDLQTSGVLTTDLAGGKLLKGSNLLFANNSPLMMLLKNFSSIINDTNENTNNHLSRSSKNSYMLPILEILQKLRSPEFSKVYVDGGKTISSLSAPRVINDVAEYMKNQDTLALSAIAESHYGKNLWLRATQSNDFVRRRWEVNSYSVSANTQNEDIGFQETSEVDRINYALAVYSEVIAEDIDKYNSDENTQFKMPIKMFKMMNPTFSDKRVFMFQTTLGVNLLELSGISDFISNKEGASYEKVIDDTFSIYSELLYENIIEPELKRIIEYYTSPDTHNVFNNKEAFKYFLQIPVLNEVEISDKDSNNTSIKRSITEYLEITGKIPSENERNIRIQVAKEALLNKLKEYYTDITNSEYMNEKDYIVFNTLTTSKLANRSKAKFNGVDFKDINNLNNLNKLLYLEYKINESLNFANNVANLTGDLAYYSDDKYFRNFKDENGNIDFNELFVNNTGDNFGKRMASIIAQGYTLANSNSVLQQDYVQLYLKDVKSVSENILDIIKMHYSENEISDKLKKHKATLEELTKEALDGNNDAKSIIKKEFPNVSDFLAINATDAQEYTTYEEHIHILVGQGKISKEDADKLIKKLKLQSEQLLKNQEFNEDSLLTSEELKTVLQPIKPVYTGLVRNKDVTRPVYIKSSSYPLIPQITSHFEIDYLRQYMEKVSEEKGALVRASYSTANKVGGLDKTLEVFDSKGKFNKDLLKDKLDDNILNNAHLMLPRRNFKIQMEVPVKDKDSISLGTQIHKLLFGNGVLDIESTFNYKGEEVTASKLQQLYNTTFKDLISLKALELYDLFGLDANGNPLNWDYTFNVFKNILIEEAKGKGYSNLEIKLLEEDYTKSVTNPSNLNRFVLDLSLNPYSHRYQSLILSYLNKRVLGMKMPGTSLVTASNKGYSLKSDLASVQNSSWSSKIIYTSKFLEQGKLQGTTLKEEGISYAQVMMPHKIKINDEWVSFFNKDGTPNTDYVEIKEGKLVLKEEMIDKDLLTRVSFRIPTSAHLSASAVEIIGILPPEAGDLIIVPDQFITQKGLDFDIDKENLYGHFATYKEVKLEDGRVVKKIVKYNKTLNGDRLNISNIRGVKRNTTILNGNKGIYNKGIFSNTDRVLGKQLILDIKNSISDNNGNYIYLFEELWKSLKNTKYASKLSSKIQSHIKSNLSEIDNTLDKNLRTFTDYLNGLDVDVEHIANLKYLDEVISELLKDDNIKKELEDYLNLVKSNSTIPPVVISDNPLYSMLLSYYLLKNIDKNDLNISTEIPKGVTKVEGNYPIYVTEKDTKYRGDDSLILLRNSLLKKAKETIDKAEKEKRNIDLINELPEVVKSIINALKNKQGIVTENSEYINTIKTIFDKLPKEHKKIIFTDIEGKSYDFYERESENKERKITITTPNGELNTAYSGIFKNEKEYPVEFSNIFHVKFDGKKINGFKEDLSEIQLTPEESNIYVNSFGGVYSNTVNGNNTDVIERWKRVAAIAVANNDAIYITDTIANITSANARNSYLVKASMINKKPLFIFDYTKNKWYYIDYMKSSSTGIKYSEYNGVPPLAKKSYININYINEDNYSESNSYTEKTKSAFITLYKEYSKAKERNFKDYDVNFSNTYSSDQILINRKLNKQLMKSLDKNLKNDLVDIMLSVFSNKEMQKKIVGALSMDKAKKQVAILNQGKKIRFNSIGELSYNQYKASLGAAGKMGIGVYSNGVVKLSLLQQHAKNGKLVRLKVDASNLGDSQHSNTEKNKQNAYLKFSFKTQKGGSLGFNGKDEGWGASILSKTDGLLGEAPRAIAKVLEERQNTATDNEKEQIMGMLNVTKHTIGVDTMMVMLGFDEITLKVKGKDEGVNISYLMLKSKAVETINNLLEGNIKIPLGNEDYIDMTNNTAAVWDYFKNTLDKYDEGFFNAISINDIDLQKVLDSVISNDNFNFFESLQKVDKNKIDDILLENLKVAKLFLMLHKISKEQLKFNNITNIQSNKLGSNFYETKALYDNMRDSSKFSNVFEGIEDFLHSEEVMANSFTNAVEPFVNLVSNLFNINTQFPEDIILRNDISMSDEVKGKILKDFFIHQHIIKDVYNEDPELGTLIYNKADAIESPIIEIVKKIKLNGHPLLRNNPFIRNLAVGTNNGLTTERLYLQGDLNNNISNVIIQSGVASLLADDTNTLYTYKYTLPNGRTKSVKITPRKLALTLLNYSLITQNHSSYGVIFRAYPSDMIVDKLKGAVAQNEVLDSTELLRYMAKFMPKYLKTVYRKSIPSDNHSSHLRGSHLIRTSSGSTYIAIIKGENDNKSKHVDGNSFTIENIKDLFLLRNSTNSLFSIPSKVDSYIESLRPDKREIATIFYNFAEYYKSKGYTIEYSLNEISIPSQMQLVTDNKNKITGVNIFIKPSNHKNFFEDFIHETSHMATSIGLFEAGLPVKNQFNSKTEIIDFYNGKIAEEINNLYKLHNEKDIEMKKAFINIMQVYVKALSNERFSDKHEYYTSDIYEFIAAATSNVEFAQDLNKLKAISKGEGYMGLGYELVELLKRLFKSLMNYFGIINTNETLLTQALANSFKIMGNQEAIFKEYKSKFVEEFAEIKQEQNKSLITKEQLIEKGYELNNKLEGIYPENIWIEPLIRSLFNVNYNVTFILSDNDKANTFKTVLEDLKKHYKVRGNLIVDNNTVTLNSKKPKNTFVELTGKTINFTQSATKNIINTSEIINEFKC